VVLNVRGCAHLEFRSRFTFQKLCYPPREPSATCASPFHDAVLSTGTVETVCKEVLRACRALLSDFRMPEQDWPHILPLLQSTLNHSIRSGLGGRAPITAFTGLPADTSLRTLVPPCGKGPCCVEFVRAQRLIHIHTMETALADIHRDVHERRTRCRDAAIARHNKQTHV
jgi:hypothetical protein